MYNLLKSLILDAKDIGIQKHTIKEVAEKMKPHDEPIDPSLKEFGSFISEILDRDIPNLSSVSNECKKR